MAYPFMNGMRKTGEYGEWDIELDRHQTFCIFIGMFNLFYVLLDKNSIYHGGKALCQSPIHLPRPIGSPKGHDRPWHLRSSKCQSFCSGS